MNGKLKSILQSNRAAKYVAPAILDSISVNVGFANLMSGGDWVNLIGDPSVSLLSATGGQNNSITVNTSATANWFQFSGASASAANGNTAYTRFPYNAVYECVYSYNNGTGGFNQDAYNITKPKFRVSGLPVTGVYTVTFGASFTFAFTAICDYRINGLTLYGFTSMNPQNNLSTVVQFTGVQPNSSGYFDIYVNAETGQDMGVMNCFTVKQTA